MAIGPLNAVFTAFLLCNPGTIQKIDLAANNCGIVSVIAYSGTSKKVLKHPSST